MTTDQDGPDPVTVVPVTITPPAHRRRPVLAAGLGVAGVVTALAACQPTSTPSSPSATYTSPPSVPSYPSSTPPSTTTTTETPTTTPDDPGYVVPAPAYTPPDSRPPGLTQACLPTPIPQGYECTCNCVPG